MAHVGTFSVINRSYIKILTSRWKGSDGLNFDVFRITSLIKNNKWNASDYSIGFQSHSSNVEIMPTIFYNVTHQALSGAGKIFGYTKQNNEIISGISILLIHRNTLTLLAKTISGNNGYFEFNKLNMGDRYLIVASRDIENHPNFEGIMLDYIAPLQA